MNTWLYRAVSPVIFISLVACGGGSGKSKSPSNGFSGNNQSSFYSLSSATSSTQSSTPIPEIDNSTLTTYKVSVDEPSYVPVQTIKKSSGVKPAAKAKLSSSYFVFAIVDANGNVLSVTPASDVAVDENYTREDYAITVPGKPRIDRILIVGIGQAPSISVGDNISALKNAIYSPLTDVTFDVSGASTLAYSLFLEEIAAAGLEFDTDALPVNQSAQLTSLGGLIDRIEDELEANGLDSNETLDTILANGKQYVLDIVKSVVTNYSHQLSTDTYTLVSTLNDGGLYWMEAFSTENITFGGFPTLGKEFIKHFNGSTWTEETDTYQEIVLNTKGEWVVTEESWEIVKLNDDGSIDLKDGEDAFFTENVKATQVIDLSNRSMSNFFLPEADAVAINSLVGTAKFSSGAIALRADSLMTSSYYSLWYNPGNSEGECGFDDVKASTLGGNCATASGFVQLAGVNYSQWTGTFTTLDQIKTPDVEGVTAGVYMQLPVWNSDETLTVKLIDNAEKTAEFYMYRHDSDEPRYISSGTWSEITLPNSTMKAIITLIPEIFAITGDIDDENLNVLFSVHNGFVRQGDFGVAGNYIERGMLIFNKVAYDDIIVELDK